MNRRAFLLSLAATGGGGLALVIGNAACWGGAPFHVELTDYLTDAPSARLIGELYLKIEPTEKNEDQLVDLVFPTLRSAPGPPLRDEILSRFLARVRSDFEESQIVRVGGWLLSRTEARLYALVALA